MNKRCGDCGQTKPIDQFGARRGRVHWRCLACEAAYQRAYRARNRDEILRYGREWRAANPDRKYHKPELVEARRERNRRLAWDHKRQSGCVGTLDGPCTFGAPTDPRVLTFDHLGDDKEADIAHLVQSPSSVERLVAEIAKCAVRCWNCHMIVTWERAENYAHRYHLASL